MPSRPYNYTDQQTFSQWLAEFNRTHEQVSASTPSTPTRPRNQRVSSGISNYLNNDISSKQFDDDGTDELKD